jgi:hypothetical protein
MVERFPEKPKSMHWWTYKKSKQSTTIGKRSASAGSGKARTARG